MVNVTLNIDTKRISEALDKFVKAQIEAYMAAKQMHLAMQGQSSQPSGLLNSYPAVDITVLKGLMAKLTTSEKILLREKGLHPRKNRTGNLINYMEDFDEKEIQMLIDFIKREMDVHEGMLPLMNRNYVLEIIHRYTKKSSPRRKIRGASPDFMIGDDVDIKTKTRLGKLDKKAERIRSKQKLMPRKM